MRAGSPSVEHRVKFARQGSDWLSLLLIALFAALISAAGYFAFQYMDRSTFNDARAFRVLDELVSQFENFQTTMTSLLEVVPEASARRSKYADTWVLPQLKLNQEETECTQSDAREPGKFVLLGRASGLPFSVARCVEVEDENDIQNTHYHRLEVRGSLRAQLPSFISQDFFDGALIGSRNAELLIDITKGGDTPGTVQIQQTRSNGVPIVDISDLLRRGALEIAGNSARKEPKDEKKDQATPQVAAPAHPVVFQDRIAGETYRIYVIAFRPSTVTQLTETGAPLDPLYVIGLKRQSWAEQLSAGLGPSSNLMITLVVLLVIVIWPLVSLRFAAPRDPIPHMQVIALATAALLLPAILTVTAVWAWNNLHLRSWADSGAEVYAQQIETVLRSELNESARLLTQYGAALHTTTRLEKKGTASFPKSNIRLPHGDRAPQADPPHCQKTSAATLDHPILLRVADEDPACALRNWSPLRTVFELDLEGKSQGHRLTAFGAIPYRRSLSLPDREYFKAIRDHEEWRPDGLWQPPLPEHGFIAQRLFSRGDAARVLVIAAPIEEHKKRVGVATGDTRAYALSAAIRVPLLRFAIVNASNGAVLFHSNDQRSLAENFLIETEDDPSLQRALTRRASAYTMNSVSREDHFSGEYLGAAHRFFYRPVAGVPWGIVVFYPVSEIATVAQQAGIAALASYMSLVFSLVALFIILFTLLPKRGDLLLLSLLWPRWEARSSYRSLACCLAVILATLVALLLWELNGTEGPRAHWWVVAAEICFALCLLVWKSASQKEVTLRTYHAWYLTCMVLLMLLVSALPAAWMTTTYQDVALRAYLRDQLTLAAGDLERRESLMARDIRRWVDDAPTPGAKNITNIDNYPAAKDLSAILASPGYRSDWKKDVPCTSWKVVAFDLQPWVSASGPRKLGYFGRTMWELSIDSNLQRVSRSRPAFGTDSNLVRPTQAGRCAWDGTSIPYWRRHYDGEVARLEVPIAAPQPPPALRRDSDIDWHYKHSAASMALALLLMLLLALTLIASTLARRLFGIRIPFAPRYVDQDATEAMPIGQLLSVELYIARIEKQEGTRFTTKDGDDIRMAECEATYLGIWSKRSQDERLLLHQLAEGKFANPENRGVIERLLHLGYLRLDPWPTIADRGLAAYARHAEDDSLFEKWQRAASSNTWNRIRTPLLLVVIVLVGVLMWVAGSTMQILSATLAGMATLFGYFTQVTNLFKKGEERPRAE